VKIAVVLLNLGGPDSLEAVEPFLRNLFSDRAILPLPGFLRRPLARMIAARRAPIAREIYAKIGGRSPILEETEAQARALEAALEARGHEARAFIAMRAWKPFAAEAVQAVKAWSPEWIVLAPLYPQFSTVTTQSALQDWGAAAGNIFSGIQTSRLCCYPTQQGFVTAEADLIRAAFAVPKPGVDYRLLLSAHGLPERTVTKGDPYRWQVEKTAQAIVDELGMTPLDWSICYQSRVGPLKWIGPATDAEIRRAGADGKGVIIAPIAFVSEHSETLVELDLDYAALAREAGVPDYRRVPTARTHPDFIAGLAGLIVRAAQGEAVVTFAGGRICPAGFRGCGFGGSHA
jgi:ferrochelatase